MDAIWRGAWLITAKLLNVLWCWSYSSFCFTVFCFVWTLPPEPQDGAESACFNNSTSARGCECSLGGAVSWQELASWYIVLVFLLHHQANLNEVILWWDGKVHKHIDTFIYAWLQKWHFDLADMSFWCFMGQSSFHISNILKFVECSLTLPSILHCGILKSADRL